MREMKWIGIQNNVPRVFRNSSFRVLEPFSYMHMDIDPKSHVVTLQEFNGSRSLSPPYLGKNTNTRWHPHIYLVLACGDLLSTHAGEFIQTLIRGLVTARAECGECHSKMRRV